MFHHVAFEKRSLVFQRDQTPVCPVIHTNFKRFRQRTDLMYPQCPGCPQLFDSDAFGVRFLPSLAILDSLGKSVT